MLVRPGRVGRTGAGAQRSSLWTPGMLSGVTLWLDAAANETITITGLGVSSWANKMGAAGAATQSTDASRPTRVPGIINGLPVVRFVDQYLNGAISFNAATVSVFVVASMGSGTASAGRAFGMASSAGTDSSSAGCSFLARSTTAQAVRGIYNSTAFTAHNVTYDAPFLWGLVKNAVDFNTYLNDGTPVNTVLTGTPNSVRYAVGTNLAASNTYGTTYWRGDIGEVLFLSREVTTAERNRVFGYLAHKWGRTASLPSDHPYKSLAP